METSKIRIVFVGIIQFAVSACNEHAKDNHFVLFGEPTNTELAPNTSTILTNDNNSVSYGTNTPTHKTKRFLKQASDSLLQLKGVLSKWSLSQEEARKQFNNYYECQAAKVSSLMKEEFPIRAMLAVEGEKVTLTCPICHRPDQQTHLPQWQFLRHEETRLFKISKCKKMKVRRDNSLVIQTVDLEDAGQYFCLDHHDYAAVWQLDIFLSEKRRFVRMDRKAQHPEKFLWNRNLRLFTQWGSWGECNTCGRLGNRSRTGQCMVKKIYSDIPIFPRDYPLMMLYPAGVPCHSTALPLHLRRLPSIRERESLTLVSPCSLPCPTEPPTRVITDENNNIVEVIKPGFYSLDEKPKLPSPIKHKVLYRPENSHLVLRCPGDLKEDQIRWQRGDRDVSPMSIRRQTMGRVWLDGQRQLHIDPLLLSDSAVYKCWEQSRRVAVIKLLVVDKVGEELKLYISYVGLAVTVFGSITLFICLCCKKRNKEAR